MKDDTDYDTPDLFDDVPPLDFENAFDENTYVCSLCGHNHDEDDSHVFCEECGMPMDGGNAP